MATFVLEDELRAALLAMSAVADIVGTRIYTDTFWSDTYPAICFEVDSEDRENTLTGRGGIDTGMVFADVNVICRADTRAASRTLAEAVRVNGTTPGTGLAGYTGTFDAWLEDEQPAAVPKDDKSNAHWFDVNMSCTLSWEEAT